MLDILEDTGLLRARPVETPMDPNVKLCVDQGELLHNPDQYRRLVGRLNYLTITRPDISFAVNLVSQCMSASRHPYWEAVLRIVKYLKLHPGRGLLYRASGHALRCSLILIGQEDRLIGGPLLDIVFFLVEILSIGRVRSKQWWLGLVQK